MNRFFRLVRGAVTLLLVAGVCACQGTAADSRTPVTPSVAGAPPLERLEAAAAAAGMPPDEMEALLSIARAARPDRRSLRSELREAQQTLRTELARSSPNEEEVVRLVLAFSDVETRMRVHNMRTLLHMYDAVSPEYRDVLGTMTPGHEAAQWRGRRDAR